MTEEEKIDISAATAAKQKSLELLFDYTKFHIGLYLTLTAAYVTVATAKIGDKPILTLDHRFVFTAVIFFILAGLSGGVIASSITQTSARSSKEFLLLPIGPWELKAIHFRARVWTWIEHTAFWIGLVLALLSFQPGTQNPLDPAQGHPQPPHSKKEMTMDAKARTLPTVRND